MLGCLLERVGPVVVVKREIMSRCRGCAIVLDAVNHKIIANQRRTKTDTKNISTVNCLILSFRNFASFVARDYRYNKKSGYFL